MTPRLSLRRHSLRRQHPRGPGVGRHHVHFTVGKVHRRSGSAPWGPQAIVNQGWHRSAASRSRRRRYAPDRRDSTVWDRIETNVIPQTISDAGAALYLEGPPNVLWQTPYGHHISHRSVINFARRGFRRSSPPSSPLPMANPSARHSAVGRSHGSPLGAEVEARNTTGLAAAINAAEATLKDRFCDGPMTSTMQGIVFTSA